MLDSFSSKEALLEDNVKYLQLKNIVEKLMENEKYLIKAMKKCKDLTEDEKTMVLDKLSKTVRILNK